MVKWISWQRIEIPSCIVEWSILDYSEKFPSINNQKMIKVGVFFFIEVVKMKTIFRCILPIFSIINFQDFQDLDENISLEQRYSRFKYPYSLARNYYIDNNFININTDKTRLKSLH